MVQYLQQTQIIEREIQLHGNKKRNFRKNQSTSTE